MRKSEIEIVSEMKQPTIKTALLYLFVASRLAGTAQLYEIGGWLEVDFPIVSLTPDERVMLVAEEVYHLHDIRSSLDAFYYSNIIDYLYNFVDKGQQIELLHHLRSLPIPINGFNEGE